MASTKIEWADAVWNPITGCTPISEGCDHCYAKRMANRLAGRYGYPADDPFRVTFHEDQIKKPLKWKKPRKVFVCSMGDLFHEDASESWINEVIERMVCSLTGAPQHTYMLLTKRPDRILKSGNAERFSEWPNTWLGVTAENQARADERIPILLQITAVVRFISVEPMLGPVDMVSYLQIGTRTNGVVHSDISWVICGGETGPGARPMHPDWVRSLRDQCREAGVPFFFKGWGEYGYSNRPGADVPKKSPDCVIPASDNFMSMDCYRIGKKSAGRLLDGREWNEFPK